MKKYRVTIYPTPEEYELEAHTKADAEDRVMREYDIADVLKVDVEKI